MPHAVWTAKPKEAIYVHAEVESPFHFQHAVVVSTFEELMKIHWVQAFATMKKFDHFFISDQEPERSLLVAEYKGGDALIVCGLPKGWK